MLGGLVTTGAWVADPEPGGADGVGLFDSATASWQLRRPDGTVDRFVFGVPGDLPLLGDWDCNTSDTVGVYRPTTGFVYLRNSNSIGFGDKSFFFGLAGDIPLVGDFDGNGCDSVSIYRPSQAKVYVSNRLETGFAENSYFFGVPGDQPFSGDFDGDGLADVGLHRASTGLVYMRFRQSTGSAELSFIYGNPSDRIVAGDWDGDGDDTVGIFRPTEARFYLSYQNRQGFADACFGFGRSLDLPVSGFLGASAAGAYTGAACTATTTTTTVGTTTSVKIPTTIGPVTSIPSTPTLPAINSPIRAAFFDPAPDWRSVSHLTPVRGYANPDAATIGGQVDEMLAGRITVAIADWRGRNDPDHAALQVLDQAASPTSLRWAARYLPEASSNPAVATIVADLQAIAAQGSAGRHTTTSGPVVFVATGSTDGCDRLATWKTAENQLRALSGTGLYLNFGTFSGFEACPVADQPEAYHPNASVNTATAQTVIPTGSNASTAGSVTSFTVSPGDWQAADQRPVRARDLERFRAGVRNMMASPSPWQVVNSFNHWITGNPVEPAQEFPHPSGKGAYLSVLSENGAAQADPKIAAAGDIQPNSTESWSGAAITATLLEQLSPHTILPLGDLQYDTGTLSDFNTYFAANWGRPTLKARTKPVPGNHDHVTEGAAGYASYYGTYPTGPAGPAGKFYYSFDVGQWHLVALNSNCAEIGGCGAGSTQEQWLRADLAAHPNACVLAYWHHPRFSSGMHGDDATVGPLFQALYDAGAEIVLTSHDHDYERFAPQRPDATRDDAGGLVEIVVGTGGNGTRAFGTIRANSLVRDTGTYGVLQLTLHANSADIQFVSQSGDSFSDTATISCH